MIAACAANPGKPDSRIVAEGSRARLVLMETTDLHSNIRSYDYYKLAADPSLGLERTTTLIRQARAEFPNTLLFDAASSTLLQFGAEDHRDFLPERTGG